MDGRHCRLLIFKMLKTVIFLNLKELQYSLRMKKTIICLILINIPIQKRKYIYALFQEFRYCFVMFCFSENPEKSMLICFTFMISNEVFKACTWVGRRFLLFLFYRQKNWFTEKMNYWSQRVTKTSVNCREI